MNEIFFTIVIPTYNPRNFLPRILDSISHNNCTDKIEVILSDDCSTEVFDDIVAEYSSKLIIRNIINDKHYGFPRTGRQNGADAAQGIWITFADQDDYFIDGSFDKLYDFIRSANAKNYVTTDLIEERPAYNDRVLHDSGKGWTHGKLYEKAFLNKYNIEYDNVDYCEDINFNNIVGCTLIGEEMTFNYFNEPIYVWARRENSLSDADYFIKSFPDYIKGTLGVILDFVKKYRDNEKVFCQFVIRFITTMYHMFFYLQSPFFDQHKKEMLDAIYTIQPIYDDFKEAAKINSYEIIRLTSTDLLREYQETRNDDFMQIPFIEQMTFKDWMLTFFN